MCYIDFMAVYLAFGAELFFRGLQAIRDVVRERNLKYEELKILAFVTGYDDCHSKLISILVEDTQIQGQVKLFLYAIRTRVLTAIGIFKILPF